MGSLLGCAPAPALPRLLLQDGEAVLHQEEEEKSLLMFFLSPTLCFGGWSRAPAALLRHPPQCFTRPYPAWEAAAPGIASSTETSSLGGRRWRGETQNTAQLCFSPPCCNCSALLPCLTVNLWDYSPATWVMFPFLNEHSGSESAALLGAAALGASLPGLPGGWGAWTSPGLRTQGWRTQQPRGLWVCCSR